MKPLPQLLDCTIRDGGYINHWNFSLPFAQNLYQAASRAGCSYSEVGFFNPTGDKKYPWTNCSAETLKSLKEAFPNGSKLAVMVDFGSVTIDQIPEASQYPADLIRVATPKPNAAEATQFAAQIAEKGFQTTINYMGISNYTNEEIIALLDHINKFKESVSYFYVADSFGSLLPSRTREIFTTLRFGTEAALGFHPHNNLQLAFANSLEAIEAGVDILDGSVLGMGRGAGNLFTEAIVAYFEQIESPRYQLLPILQFAELFMEPLKQTHSWGYSLPQLISGTLKCHPNYPTNLLKEKNYTAAQIYRLLGTLEEEKKPRYNKDNQSALKQSYLHTCSISAEETIGSDLQTVLERHKEAPLLLLASGPSVLKHQRALEDFVEKNRCLVISINHRPETIVPHIVFFGNQRRLVQHGSQISPDTPLAVGPTCQEGLLELPGGRNISRLHYRDLLEAGASPFPFHLAENSTSEALACFAAMGFRKMFIAGLDGFNTENDYAYQESDIGGSPEIRETHNQTLHTELEILQNLGEAKNFTFSIITPTQFTRHQTLELN